MPTVTVIVPTYNSRATLRCALQSLIAQELGDFEAWIIGDGCTDGRVIRDQRLVGRSRRRTTESLNRRKRR